MYYASGPPPERLRQLLALVDAGLVRFMGADMRVHADAETGTFVATSSSHGDEIHGTAVIDARIARPSVSRSTSVLLRRLQGRGEIVEEVVSDGEWSVNTGRVAVTGAALQLLRGGRHRPSAPPCPRRVHEPTGRRRVRSPPLQRSGVPSERPRRPRGAQHARRARRERGEAEAVVG